MRDFYGDQVRYFFGSVANLPKEELLGRVRVRIFGIHTGNKSDIDDKDLPYAQVLESGSSVPNLKPGDQVFGIFLDGKNSQVPFIIGSLNKRNVIPESKVENIINDPSEIQDDDTIKADKDNFNLEVSRVPARRTSKEVDSKLRGNTNIEKAFNFFLAQNTEDGSLFTPEQCAGICGNFFVESGGSKKGLGQLAAGEIVDAGDIKPEANNKVEGSRGIAQWNNNRWESRLLNLQTFAGEELKLDWEFCLTAQLNFVLWEFGIIESEGSGSLKGALKLLQKTNTVEEAALQFERYYEFSDKKSLKDRVDAAIAIYNIFT
jgi:hypothetical protein